MKSQDRVIGITNSLFSVVSLRTATFYNAAIYDLLQDTCRGIACLFLFSSSSCDGRRTPWIIAKRLELHLVPWEEDDGKIGALRDAITLWRLPCNLNSR